MTVKELHLLQANFFDRAMQHPEVAECVRTAGVAMVFSIEQLPDLHKIVVVSRKSQINKLSLTDWGFNPGYCEIRRLFTVRGCTKQVEFP